MHIIMLWIERSITERLMSLVETQPAVLLTGIRETGKSSLLQKLFPGAHYITFDHFRYAETARENPENFLSSLHNKQIILDEIQYVPQIFPELKILIDKNRGEYGRWILTASQKFVFMEQIRESLSGRIGLLELDTLSAAELRPFFGPDKVTNLLWKGGFPEIWSADSIDPVSYIDDYIGTYLEKDIRSIIQTPNLIDFHKILRSCSLLSSPVLNCRKIPE